MRRHARKIQNTLAAALLTSAALVGGQLVTAQPAVASPADCKLPTPSGVFHEHDGFDTDYGRWLEPDGTLRGIFLFVDFEHADGSAAELEDVTDTFGALLPAWFDDASYGNVTLDLDFTTTWRQMPKNHNQYGWPPTFNDHRAYMQDAVTIWDSAVDFRDYDLFYVVSPVGATGIFSSPAFIASPGDGVIAAQDDNVELRHGSTLAGDRETWGYQILAHETGHVFGLPDLYEYQPATNWHRFVGGWDTMGHVKGPAPDYLAYHKWKLGWLADSQIHCMGNHGWTSQTLTPLHTAGGLKAIAARIDANRLVVVELRDAASPVDGEVLPECYQAGVLVYVVDSRVGGGGGLVGQEFVMPVTVVDANSGSVAGCTNGDVAEKSNATLTDRWDWVSTPEVFVQITEIVGQDRKVQVSW